MKNTIEQSTFYFHDYETFGTHPALDRPAQFAGVRTDAEFNIIEDPLVIYCQPAKDYLPHPEAVLITGITPQEALLKGVCEAEFAKQINRAFSQSNSCILGYNNIRFDDEVTRNIFYRNFYDPYAYSWQNGNSRWDLLDVVRACYALRPEGINWPLNDKGLPSFRLEHLTKANGIAHENAHDAMSDVYATIAMAKLLKQKQPKLFDYFYSLRNKNRIAELIDVVNMTPLVHVSGMLGAYRGNTAWVSPIIWHPTQSNAVVVCDLSGDIDVLLALSADEIKARLYTKSDDLGENESRIPLKLIHTNKSPIIAPAKTLLPENAERLKIDRQQCLDNLQKIREHQHELQEKLQIVFLPDDDFFVPTDVDAQIYNGFFDKNDQNLCTLIRSTQPDLLNALTIHPNDSRIKALFFRYKAKNYPSTLTEQEQIEWQNYCRDKLNQHVVHDYLLQLENLAIQYNQQADKMSLLKSLYNYCQFLVS